jgi:LuxR family maltose regulon positive regulatory protein
MSGTPMDAEISDERHSVPPPSDLMIERPHLSARFERVRHCRLVTVTAGAGYGKTTAVAQWARSHGRPVAWLTADRHDADGDRLLADVWQAVQIARGGPADRHGDDPEEIFSGPALVLVIDDVHVAAKASSRRMLRDLLSSVPSGSQLVLVGRGTPALGLSRYRLDGRMTELGTPQLRMSMTDAEAALRARGRVLPLQGVRRLYEESEGWPAGLALAAAVGDPEVFDGTHPLVAQYFDEEVLGPMGVEKVDFVTRAATLDLLSGPACDAVLETSGSARRLAGLASEGAFVVPVGRDGEYYRFHFLFGDHLRARLHNGSSSVVRLHRRACRWYETRGLVADAVHQSLLSGDVDRAASMVLDEFLELTARGELGAVGSSLHELPDGVLRAHPMLAVARAWVDLAGGDPRRAEQWAMEAATRTTADRPTALTAALSMLDACLGTRDLEQAAAAARSVRALGPDATRWYPLACLSEGTSLLLLNEREQARRLLRESVSRSPHLPDIRCEALVQLAVLAIEDEKWEDAEAHIDEALASATPEGETLRRPTALAFAAASHVALHRRKILTARQLAGRARTLIEAEQPPTSRHNLQAVLELAETKQMMGELPVVHELLERAEELLAHEPDAVLLHDQFDRLAKERANVSMGSPAMGLTSAELRILNLLPTHLSLREIAESVHLSRNTVKTQAIAVYRKLGVSARSPAVDRARDLGLLDPR